MKSILSILGCFFISAGVFSQATFNADGNWDDPTKWVASNIGDIITENVSINMNNDATILSGSPPIPLGI